MINWKTLNLRLEHFEFLVNKYPSFYKKKIRREKNYRNNIKKKENKKMNDKKKKSNKVEKMLIIMIFIYICI